MLTLSYGGRFDVVNTISNENHISPSINAAWQATPTATLHAGYARYFSPLPFERLSITTVKKLIDTSAEPEVKTNSPVKAERDHYLDVGASQEIMEEFTGGIDAYCKYSRNHIDIGRFEAPVIFTPFNYQLARSLGVELTTSYTCGNFSIYCNLAIAYQKGKGVASTQFNFADDELAFAISTLSRPITARS